MNFCQKYDKNQKYHFPSTVCPHVATRLTAQTIAIIQP